jgi:hypothetical protein
MLLLQYYPPLEWFLIQINQIQLFRLKHTGKVKHTLGNSQGITTHRLSDSEARRILEEIFEQQLRQKFPLIVLLNANSLPFTQSATKQAPIGPKKAAH